MTIFMGYKFSRVPSGLVDTSKKEASILQDAGSSSGPTGRPFTRLPSSRSRRAASSFKRGPVSGP